MNNSQEQVDKWLREQGTQPPLLITGQDEVVIDELVAGVIKNAVTEGMVAINDVEKLETQTRTISIKQVRATLARVPLKPIRLRRIFYIRQAHRLQRAAASALLKSLEEAPVSTRYILTTRWPGRLLITIRSRCRRLSVVEVAAPRDSPGTQPSQKPIITTFNKAEEVSDEDIAALAQRLSGELADKGPSRELRLLLLRLIDYYRIKEQGGNERMAKEVLLAHLYEKKK